MSKPKGRNAAETRHDKYSEHLDETPLGKLQQQYWTTKQQVIKKLGKKEDEFVVLSDAELDSKLDLFEAIGKSSMDLLRVIEMYQDKLITLSVEEADMSSFLKSQSTYDTKTKAGKMMAAVAKAQQFAAQQHTTLRLPLVRLYNEVETFRYRAFTDTFLTVRKMEQSRTEYRGALLWMKNISLELDPDATRKLEKFRRVQAQVKKTKTKFDRLKTDAIQKIDLLSASRCNMFSHVLVNYQRTLIQFWEKTARTFNAVADSFKGYQYYEFNIIKDLVEPSKKVAEIINKSKEEAAAAAAILNTEKSESVSQLIDLDDMIRQDDDEDAESIAKDLDNKSLDDVNELIDLLTLKEQDTISEQLRELEQLEEEKKKRNAGNNSNRKEKSDSIKLLNESKLTFDFSAASISKVFSRTAANNPTAEIMATANSSISNSINANKSDLADLDFTQSPNVSKTFNDLLINTNDEFEREWQSAFTSTNISNKTNGKSEIPVSSSQDEFGMFVTATPPLVNSGSSSEIKSLFSYESLLKDQLLAPLTNSNAKNSKPSSDATSSKSDNRTKSSESSIKPNISAWYDLFSDLDPLKNPDAIGKTSGLEEERNC